VAHVGDSTVVMGTKSSEGSSQDRYQFKVLTKDHKPSDEDEKKMVESRGGSIKAKQGFQRVVWERKSNKEGGGNEKIPFLAITRSIGDFWSYSEQSGEFAVSPIPDVTTFRLDRSNSYVFIIASDGLWNVVSPMNAMKILNDTLEKHQTDEFPPKISHHLVDVALRSWRERKCAADNIGVMVVAMEKKWVSPECKKQHNEQWSAPSINGSNENCAKDSGSSGKLLLRKPESGGILIPNNCNQEILNTLLTGEMLYGFENKIKQEFSADQTKNQDPIKKEPKSPVNKVTVKTENPNKVTVKTENSNKVTVKTENPNKVAVKTENFELKDIKKELEFSNFYPVKKEKPQEACKVSPWKRERCHSNPDDEPGYQPVTKKRASWVKSEVKQENV